MVYITEIVLIALLLLVLNFILLIFLRQIWQKPWGKLFLGLQFFVLIIGVYFFSMTRLAGRSDDQQVIQALFTAMGDGDAAKAAVLVTDFYVFEGFKAQILAEVLSDPNNRPTSYELYPPNHRLYVSRDDDSSSWRLLDPYIEQLKLGTATFPDGSESDFSALLFWNFGRFRWELATFFFDDDLKPRISANEASSLSGYPFLTFEQFFNLVLFSNAFTFICGLILFFANRKRSKKLDG
ncbi:MAG: hypothetical protein AAGD96_34040 [Chloroflexota bacterium]